jgi:site-specific recombinase XerD
MTDNDARYQKECESIRKANAQLLKEFSAWLRAKGLSDKTVRTHCENMDFYLNRFLLYEDAEEAASGVSRVNMFLGYWFIKKAMWASTSSIQSNGASLKRFYSFMAEKGRVDKGELDELKAEIREGMPEWLETMARYDDPDVDFEDVWGV